MLSGNVHSACQGVLVARGDLASDPQQHPRQGLGNNLMQIAPVQMWGPGNHTRLDHVIVVLPHPEATAGVLNPGHEINTHFATSTLSRSRDQGGAADGDIGFRHHGWLHNRRHVYLAREVPCRGTPRHSRRSFAGKDMEYTKVPSRVGKPVDFLCRTGSVKTKPFSWRDLFL